MKYSTCFVMPTVVWLISTFTHSHTCAAGEPHQEVTNRTYKTTVMIGEQFEPKSQREQAEYGHELALESLSTEEYMSGSWGNPTNGLRLSVRFQRNHFTQGNPIEMVILLRNVGQSPMDFEDPTWENYRFDLHLQHDGEVVIPLIPRVNRETLGDGSSGGGLIHPATQWRFTMRLDKIFDLKTPGSYQLVAEREFLDKNQRLFKLRSGIARFQIVAKKVDPEKRAVVLQPTATNANEKPATKAKPEP